MTDSMYRLQADLAAAGTLNTAPYEPMAMRGQAYMARLAHKQAIQTYIYTWKQVVATIGLRQLPLSQVAGRIDAIIPYYDFDKVLDRVLRNHTDVLTARNGIEKARYQLKLAQITPLPDVDVNVGLLQEFVIDPKQMTPMASIGLPLFPVWDQNKGNIMAAEAALIRATEEPHRVEENLTNLLATNYTNYKTNLDALDYYRRRILPDQVRAYRGVLDRRQVDPSAAFSDVFGAADLGHQRHLLPDDFGDIVDVGRQRRGLAANGRPVPTRRTEGFPRLARLGTFACVAVLPSRCRFVRSGSDARCARDAVRRRAQVSNRSCPHNPRVRPTRPGNGRVVRCKRGGRPSFTDRDIGPKPVGRSATDARNTDDKT